MPHNAVLHTAMANGTLVEIAPLEVIDFVRLASQEPAEVEKLLKSAQTPGFFYLDLQSNSTRKYLADLQTMYAVTEKYFDQPHEVKVEDYRVLQERGYKPGELGGSFEIARNEMVQKTLVLPAILQDHANLFEQFTLFSHYIAQTMLSCLSNALKLHGAARFENSNRDSEPSDSGLKLVCEPTQETLADVTENKHTDGGTLTLLFSEQWGTQLELPETKRWAFIEPKPGHALINVADSLDRLSGGRLHSCLHRVTQPVDGFQKRLFVLYFLRPEKTDRF